MQSPELISSFFMLQLFEGFGFNLSDSFPGHTHHLTDLFQGEGSKIAGNPGAVQEGFILDRHSQVASWQISETKQLFFLHL